MCAAATLCVPVLGGGSGGECQRIWPPERLMLKASRLSKVLPMPCTLLETRPILGLIGPPGKFSQYQDGEKDESHRLMDKASNATSTAKDSVNSAAYGTQRFASQKASEMADIASDKLGDAKNLASEKANQVMDAAADMVRHARDRGKNTASGAYAPASEKVGNTPTVASDLAGDANYKVKEKAHDAYVYASDKISDVKNLASEKANQAMDAAANMVHHIRDRGKYSAVDAYALPLTN